MPFTATKNGRTFEELELEINRTEFHDIWQVIMARLYPSSRIRNTALRGQRGEQFYRGIIPFQLAGEDEVFDTKLPYSDVEDALQVWKDEKISDLNVEFTELQRRWDLHLRLKVLDQLFIAKGNLGLFAEFNNRDILEKHIIDNDMTAEIDLLEAENTRLVNETIFQEDVGEVTKRMALGNRAVATINKMNRDNSITTLQVQAILADTEIQLILQLLQTGALESAKTLIQAKDLSTVPPMDQSYKDRVIAMIDEYLA